MKHNSYKLNMYQLKDIISHSRDYLLEKYSLPKIKKLYWGNKALIIKLIKECWLELDNTLLLDINDIRSLIERKFVAIYQYMNSASYSFEFDKLYIAIIVENWLLYVLKAKCNYKKDFKNSRIALNTEIELYVDCRLTDINGELSYIIFSFDRYKCKFLQDLKELNNFKIYVAYISDKICTLTLLVPNDKQISLSSYVENMIGIFKRSLREID